MDRAVSLSPELTKVKVPGEIGVWVFVFGDMTVFGLFFATYLYYRHLDLASFLDAQNQLNAWLGLTNTLVLLLSSWAVVGFMGALRLDKARTARLFLRLAIACGCIFVGIKYVEYSEKIEAGLTLLTNDFFMYYYVLTGIHLIHLLVGMGVLLYTYFSVVGVKDKEARITYAECAATYWHMVDLLWLFLFPLLYLIRS